MLKVTAPFIHRIFQILGKDIITISKSIICTIIICIILKLQHLIVKPLMNPVQNNAIKLSKRIDPYLNL